MTVSALTNRQVPPYGGAEVPAAEVTAILHRLNPAALAEAGAAHSALGRELDTMAAQLAQEAGTLAQHWSGAAARNALAQFARLHTQTAALAAQAGRTGSVLTWLGTQVVPAFRDPADPDQAQQYLTQLSAALIRANGALPTQIGATVTAQLASASGTPHDPGPSGRPTSPEVPANATASASSTTNATSASTTPGSLINPANTASTIDTVSTTDTASPGATASTAGPGSTLGPAATAVKAQVVPTASRLQSTPPAPVPATAPAHNTPATSAASADPVPAAAGGTAAAAPAAAAIPLMSRFTLRSSRSKQAPTDRDDAQDSGLSGGALPVQPATDPTTSTLTATPAPAGPSSHGTLGTLPMAGGVSSPGEHERQRESWAPEDRNPWGLPDTCVPPLIEGS